MAGEAAATLSAVRAVQTMLGVLEATLHFGAYLCPLDAPIDTIQSIGAFDYVIAGGGSAGLVLANRLSAAACSVLVLEQGGCPPFESDFAGYFTTLPLSKYDLNVTSTNDRFSCQGLRNGVADYSSGVMLGGSSSLHHTIHVRGDVCTYRAWSEAAGDPAWDYSHLTPYFKKSEASDDECIMAQYPNDHGTRGPTILRRQHSSENCRILEGFEELGYKVVSDVNNAEGASSTFNVNEPQYEIGDCYRQSSLVSYLYPVKDRKNLYVLTGATVSKVIFDGRKVATGVRFAYGGTSYTVKAKQEVILSAGALRTPQILMLSGIGPAEHLKSKKIKVISDLPVGKNLQDHACSSMFFGLEKDTSPVPAGNPSDFPVPSTTNYFNLDDRDSECSEGQSINLLFKHDSAGLGQLVTNSFKFNNSISDKIIQANVNRTILMSIVVGLHPKSRGEVLLNTTDINDPPIVRSGLLAERADAETIANGLAHMARLAETAPFRKAKAEIIDLEICSEFTKYSIEYWVCHAVAMSSTTWHPCGTAPLGSVLDAALRVRGVARLRVVDASAIPAVPSGNINAAVLALAEKGADLILSRGSLEC